MSSFAFFSGKQNERRTYEPHEHAVSAANGAQEACAGRTGGAFTECVIEEIAAAEETSRSEQDLEAQQQMSLWAMLMFLASTATLAATVWALFYVKGTLDETKRMAADTNRMANEARKATRAATQASKEAAAASDAMLIANDIARKNLDEQMRPFLGIRPITDEAIILPDGTFSEGAVEFEIVNFGKGPAIVTRIERYWEICPSEGYAAKNWVGKTKDVHIVIGPNAKSNSIDCRTDRIRRKPVPSGAWINFACRLWFQDTEDREYEAGFLFLYLVEGPRRGLHLALPPDGGGDYNYHREIKA